MSGRTRRSDGLATRRRVLDAAEATILELGYYRASSNEIARRADVTWGTIQHQFGSRQELLLAVLVERWEAFVATVASATISGDTLEERLDALFDVLAIQYGGDSHLVQVQILLDLANDPAASAAVRRTITAYGEQLIGAWQPLLEQALGAAAPADLVRYTFLTLRGFLAAGVFSRSVAEHGTDDVAMRSMLVRGVAEVVRQELAARRQMTNR